jgi:uncharacterized protein
MREDRPSPVPSILNLAAAAVVTVGLIICAVVASQSFVRARTGEETIRVIGSARKPIRSDLVIWRGRITRDAPSVSQAYAQLKADMGRAKAYLVSSGIPKSAIVPLSVNASTLYAQTKSGGGGPAGTTTTYQRVVGYELIQEIEVRSEEVDLVDRVSRQSTEMIGSGIRFESEPPLYLYTKLSKLKVTMQAEAARDARARAEQIAASSGCAIGKLRFARMNVPQITPLYSAQESDGGFDDTTAIDKKITAIVVAGYSIR